ncbi:armadillo-like helical domain-containing protein 2 [Trichosurus vulpecula]|uniref:armadillo-like helical domain-containing protein 2 n=1 Tax=Trichosurus vulpecula TaxID=9337 RepID=UPI00186B5306|nr:armadillo-like helical domain-containing protein 2 [Trichosurus vulpecula]
MAQPQNICQQCMALIVGIFTKIFSFFKNLCFHQRKEKKASAVESVFHKEKIVILGYQLKNRSLSLEKRAQAAFRLGLLAFTGGPMAAKWVSDYMNDIALLLQRENLPPRIKIMLLQSVSSWCYLNVWGQKRARFVNIIAILVSFLEEEVTNPELKSSMMPVKFWSCYLLAIIICNNMPVVQELTHHTSLKFSLQLLASENWLGWPENFAEVLFFLLGYHRT